MNKKQNQKNLGSKAEASDWASLDRMVPFGQGQVETLGKSHQTTDAPQFMMV
jgi:hypothetical protein